MIHVKWLIALVLTAALSATTAAYIAHKFTEEDMLAQMSEIMVENDTWYTRLLQEMDEGKYLSAKTKLGWLRGFELNRLNEFKKQLEAGYFASRNAEAIDTINRQAAPARPKKTQ